MSFEHPERLLLLVGLIGLVGGYLVLQQRRRRAIATYTNPALHAAIAPNQRGWRRHLGPAIGLLALVALVGAVAQPTWPHKVPRDEGVVILAVDVSASMAATDIAPTRMEAAKVGAEGFIDGLPDGIEVGLVAFDGSARTLVSPTADHDAVIAAVKGLHEGPRTAAGEAIFTSLHDISEAVGDSKKPAAIVLLSDGTTTTGRSVTEAADAAHQADISITTIAYGTPDGTVTMDGQVIEVPADTQAMAQVADMTGGTAFVVTTAGELQDVYRDIQTKIGYTTIPQEATTVLMGAAFVFLLTACGAALFTSARPL